MDCTVEPEYMDTHSRIQELADNSAIPIIGKDGVTSSASIRATLTGTNP